MSSASTLTLHTTHFERGDFRRPAREEVRGITSDAVELWSADQLSSNSTENRSISLELPSLFSTRLIAYFSQYIAQKREPDINCFGFALWMTGHRNELMGYADPDSPGIRETVEKNAKFEGFLNLGQLGVVARDGHPRHAVVGLGEQPELPYKCIQVSRQGGLITVTDYNEVLWQHDYADYRVHHDEAELLVSSVVDSNRSASALK